MEPATLFKRGMYESRFAEMNGHPCWTSLEMKTFDRCNLYLTNMRRNPQLRRTSPQSPEVI